MDRRVALPNVALGKKYAIRNWHSNSMIMTSNSNGSKLQIHLLTLLLLLPFSFTKNTCQVHHRRFQCDIIVLALSLTMQFKKWLEWLYSCAIIRKLSAMFEIEGQFSSNVHLVSFRKCMFDDIGDHHRQDLENCDEDSVENKEALEDNARTRCLIIHHTHP